jgi:hypothetical protein
VIQVRVQETRNSVFAVVAAGRELFCTNVQYMRRFTESVATSL